MNGYQFDRPAVSVLMPVYNCATFLHDAINSIRHQTYTDWELILVNDGSTDGSLDIMRRHAAADPRLKIIDRANGGIVAALNAGLEHCVGEYIARMDGDDLSLPDRFERQLRVIDQNSQLGAVGGQVSVIDESGMPLDWIQYPVATHDIHNALLRGCYAMLHPTLLIRRNILDRVGRYDAQFVVSEDLDLLLRLSEVTCLQNLPDTVLQYRVRAGSASDLRREMCAYWDYKALCKAKDRGHSISRLTLARAAERVSWSSLDTDEYHKGFTWAWRAFTYSPFSLCGVRATTRAVVRWTKNWLLTSLYRSKAVSE